MSPPLCHVDRLMRLARRATEVLRPRLLLLAIQGLPEAHHTYIVPACAGHSHPHRRCLEADGARVVGAAGVEEFEWSDNHVAAHAAPAVVVERPLRSLFAAHREVWASRSRASHLVGAHWVIEWFPLAIKTVAAAFVITHSTPQRHQAGDEMTWHDTPCQSQGRPHERNGKPLPIQQIDRL